MNKPAATESIEQNRHYRIIGEALAYIERQRERQPTLAEMAAHVHLSEFHFQRLFSEWAGVSPKRYLQFLTLEYAKQQLAGSRNLAELADSAGLSGQSRLHDLFVKLQAMTPGEFGSDGKGLEIRLGRHGSPFGEVLLATTARGICHLAFVDGQRGDEGFGEATAVLKASWPNARFSHDSAGTGMLVEQIFSPLAAGKRKPLSVLVKGSNLQVQVWRALLELPFGSLCSYGQLAERLGRPGAARAVGTAIGANPLAYLIPCHRVIRQSGERGVYHWGSRRKGMMQAWEAARSSPRDPAMR